MSTGNYQTVRLIPTLAQWLLPTLILGNTLNAAAGEQNIEFFETAPGIYLHLGKHEDMSVDNFGDIANIGFVIGTESVAVIDPGGSPQVGAAMRMSIRRLTDLPISHVILTHIHPDHIFGGSAFTDVEHVVAHRNFSRALTQRGQFYREAYSDLFTDSDTLTSLKPTLNVEDELSIDLGERKLIVRAHRTAHTDNDLSVFDSITRTLWASDLIFSRRIPSLDGSLIGWIKIMQDLANLKATLVIPGHGDPGTWLEISQPQRFYLTELLHQTRQLIARNVRLSDAVNLVAASGNKDWLLFESHHRGNVTKAYTELEWE